MPYHVLHISKNSNPVLHEVYSNNVLTIPFEVCIDGDNVEETLSLKTFTHVIIEGSDIDNKIEFNLPTLKITDGNTKNKGIKTVNSPITFNKIFTFISNTSGFSTNTLNEYALGEDDIFNELISQILEEFKESYQNLPMLIETKNLTEIKSLVHQISSKFSLVEMEKAYLLAKEIDNNIFEQPEKQLKNCTNLLIDIAIVIDQIKN